MILGHTAALNKSQAWSGLENGTPESPVAWQAASDDLGAVDSTDIAGTVDTLPTHSFAIRFQQIAQNLCRTLTDAHVRALQPAPDERLDDLGQRG